MGTPLRLFVLFSWIANVYAQTGTGIIGFGISLYPDLCCQACHDVLSTLYLNCTTFMDMSMGGMSGMDMSGMDSAPMGTTSPECYASNTPWLQTMAYCIQQNCDAHGYPAEKQAQCFANQAVAGASSPTFRESLPSAAPTTELASDAKWLNETSLVNQALYDSTYGTEGEFARSEYFHSRYAVALYLTVIGTILICGGLSKLTHAVPALRKRVQTSTLGAKLRRHLLLPALIGRRRFESLPGQVGNVPGRALGVFVALYVALNVVLSAVSFGSFQPNTFFMSRGFELCEYVGNRTGVLSLVNAGISILFAGRNNLLIALTGWGQTTFLTLHRWTARVATLQAVVHSVVYTVAYWQPGYAGFAAYAAKAAEPFYYWGIIATVAFSLAAVFAVLPFRASFYETFLALHIVLVVVALVGCWYHLVPHFTFAYGYQNWLYICFGYWTFERLARVARLAYYNAGSSPAEVAAIPGSSVMQVTVRLRAATAGSFGPGQHSFLYFPSSGKFWENHPFSVAGWTSGPGVESYAVGSVDGSLKDDAVVSTDDRHHLKSEHAGTSVTFLIRAHGGATAWLQRRLAASPTPTMATSVLLEGPYAGHEAARRSLLLADTVLCIAGGIGITAVLGYVQMYAAAAAAQGGEATSKSKRFVLAWSAREMSVIQHVRCRFLGAAPGVECLFYCTGGEDASAPEKHVADGAVALGRMDVGGVVRSHLERGQLTTVLVCGPGRMVDEVTKHVGQGIDDGFKVDMVEETFSW
ncbi:Ferric/cupric reductase transmembrane component B [Colletotrichum spinosum]|uniref:Ferric/cupric reductase transmembrane component B n=1 Tax=Colletotrichum spinosum TaxID=1347390 RepID=A0A4R8PRZ5_9PEZI|nr:Ferric/cupric reductase transmembrane component B [Colletotrichum spinosum]